MGNITTKKDFIYTKFTKENGEKEMGILLPVTTTDNIYFPGTQDSLGELLEILKINKNFFVDLENQSIQYINDNNLDSENTSLSAKKVTTITGGLDTRITTLESKDYFNNRVTLGIDSNGIYVEYDENPEVDD